jgi:hypothetical protein
MTAYQPNHGDFNVMPPRAIVRRGGIAMNAIHTAGGPCVTDDDGRAVVGLPPFVRAHRGGFAHQPTPVASARSATVTEEIVGDRFTIATDKPPVKVTWRVTGTRKTAARAVTSQTRREER